MAVTERSGLTPPPRRRNLPWSDRTVEQVVALPNWAVLGIMAAQTRRQRPGSAWGGRPGRTPGHAVNGTQINPALTTDSWVLRQLGVAAAGFLALRRLAPRIASRAPGGLVT